MMARMWLGLGALLGLIAVFMGAAGSHFLSPLSDELAKPYEIAVRYQFYHALALVGVAWAAGRPRSWLAHAAGVCFVLGIVVFCGSLYGLALSGNRALGFLTPFGGVAFMLGWLLLALVGFTQRRRLRGDAAQVA